MLGMVPSVPEELVALRIPYNSRRERIFFAAPRFVVSLSGLMGGINARASQTTPLQIVVDALAKSEIDIRHPEKRDTVALTFKGSKQETIFNTCNET